MCRGWQRLAATREAASARGTLQRTRRSVCRDCISTSSEMCTLRRVLVKYLPAQELAAAAAIREAVKRRGPLCRGQDLQDVRVAAVLLGILSASDACS